MLGDNKTLFYRKRAQVPRLIRNQQLKVKRALRAALIPEVVDFRFDQCMDALLAGDKELVALYRLRVGKKYAYDVSHVRPLSMLIPDWLRETDRCWEDLVQRRCGLAEPHLSDWCSWHRRYSAENGNLFLQPRALNNREPRVVCALPSRGAYGPF